MTTSGMQLGAALRVADLVPLRRMLGPESILVRLGPTGTLSSFHHLPSLFHTPAIREALAGDARTSLESACAHAINERIAVTFHTPGNNGNSEIVIVPIVDESGKACRFLVCWARVSADSPARDNPVPWDELHPDNIEVRFNPNGQAVDAAPWWTPPGDTALDLWGHTDRVMALGLGHAVLGRLVFAAAEELADDDAATTAVRISVPSPDLLMNTIPVFHGALRTSGVDPQAIVLVLPVAAAADSNLMPVLVHLRTMGFRIELDGLAEFTADLERITA